MTGEMFKGGIHAVASGLAMTMCLYSVLRMVEERAAQRHLIVNAIVYGVAVPFEWAQVYRHWRP